MDLGTNYKIFCNQSNHTYSDTSDLLVIGGIVLSKCTYINIIYKNSNWDIIVSATFEDNNLWLCDA